MSMMLVLPFYPIIAHERGISEFMIGLVFTTLPLSSCIFSAFISKKIESVNPRSCACLGLVSMALSLLGFTFISTFDNLGFIILSLICRVIGGLGLASIYISSMSMISLNYPAKQESFISMMEACGGFGLMMAPLYSAFATKNVSFSGSYFIFSLVLMVFIPIYWNFTTSKSRIQLINEVQKTPTKIKITKNILIDTSILIFCYTIITFLEPSMSLYLSENHISDNLISIVLSGMTFCYTITNFLMSFLTKYIKIRKLISLSATISTLGVLLAGPISIYFNTISISIIGAIITGIGAAIAFVSVLPSMIHDMTILGYNEESIVGHLSSLISICMNIGEISGPILSGVLPLIFDFSIGCSILGFIGIALIFSNFLLKTKT
ncbi:hypothetical protein SteCoe_9189 [Stentor coeruleus]|uniref:Major facilitator superfamily (MFS) profile domain-containing protein n=1 Tax=Stentor coeruleus TaxID=5963 RepID=A0A1R2CIE6_9CILI|nr:hypothetical protein SteCoe_9189 [Stentor coeruleus]